MRWNDRLRQWLLRGTAPGPTIPAGMYPFTVAGEGEHRRFHLRVEKSGGGLLLANAAEIACLSPAEAFIAHRLLRGTSESAIAVELGHGPRGREAVDRMVRVLAGLGNPSGRYPVFNVGDPLESFRSAALLAPLQADLVVLGEGRELALVDRLWAAGIPHVRLRVSAQSDPAHVLRTVERAEDIGMIAGVRGRAQWLAEPGRIEQLAAAGLDYIVVPWAAPVEWHRHLFGPADLSRLAPLLESALRWELTTVVDFPLLKETADAIEVAAEKLLTQGVSHLEVFAIVQHVLADLAADRSVDTVREDTVVESRRAGVGTPGELHPFTPPELKQLAASIEELVDRQPVQVVWLPPVVCRRGHVHAAVRGGPRCGGDLAIRVEADGDVMPARGASHAVGNLLRDDWAAIWNAPAFLQYRQRVAENTRCDDCPGMAICAADCPSELAGWSFPSDVMLETGRDVS